MIKNFMMSKLVRMLYPYGKVRHVFRGKLKGCKFHVAPGMGFTFAAGYDSLNWNYLSEKIDKGAIVYDLGANRGQSSLFLSRMVGNDGQVYAFEPVLKIYQEARQNMALNNISNVELHNCAASEKNGLSFFSFNNDFSTQGKLSDIEADYDVMCTEKFEVKTRTIDSLIDEGLKIPHVMKIDVEGGGGLLLAGASQLLEKHHPNIYIELHGPSEQIGIKKYLEPLGYCFYEMDGTRVLDPSVNWHSPLWCTVQNN